MGRARKYLSTAEKQRAYRERRRAGKLPSPPNRRPPRQRSRPERLSAVEDELRDLAEGYRHWLESLPQGISASQIAEDLQAITERLEELADEVGTLDPPRGFGR
jgi:hypothetical protein